MACNRWLVELVDGQCDNAICEGMIFDDFGAENPAKRGTSWNEFEDLKQVMMLGILMFNLRNLLGILI